MGSLLIASLAGALTTLSPCVLPILPFVIMGALGHHRWGPVSLAAGLATAFTGMGVLVSGARFALELSGDAVRTIAAVLMLGFGAVLLSSALQQRFSALASAATGGLQQALGRIAGNGLAGQFALGALLGAAWTPCSGPTLGAAVMLAASSDTLAKAAFVMLFFSVGASLPLLAIAYGSSFTLQSNRKALAAFSSAAKPVLGAMLLALGVLILSGADRAIEATLTNLMPEWLVRLTTRY